MSLRKQLSRAALYQVLEQASIPIAEQRGIHILSHLSQTEVICFGPREGSQDTCTLLDEWVPVKKDLKGDAALAELASRYISSRGPVTEYDFSGWAGLTVLKAKKGFDLVKSSFEHADHKTPGNFIQNLLP